MALLCHGAALLYRCSVMALLCRAVPCILVVKLCRPSTSRVTPFFSFFFAVLCHFLLLSYPVSLYFQGPLLIRTRASS
jgi:hypothetical protein